MGKVIDPFGHRWLIATHVEDVPSSELQSRMEAFCSGSKP
jgi:PhnB protein